MKKLLSIILSLTLVLSVSATAFATEGVETNKKSPFGNQQFMQKNNGMAETEFGLKNLRAKGTTPPAIDKIKLTAAELATLKALREKIIANKATIAVIKAEIRETHKDIILEIKDLRSTAGITQESIDAVKTAKTGIQMGRGTYEDHHFGVIKEHKMMLKNAYNNRDFSAIKNGLENIIKEQNSKIKDLNNILDNLEKVFEELKEIHI